MHGNNLLKSSKITHNTAHGRYAQGLICEICNKSILYKTTKTTMSDNVLRPRGFALVLALIISYNSGNKSHKTLYGRPLIMSLTADRREG